MGRVAFIWDLEDDPEGNYWHICVEGDGVAVHRCSCVCFAVSCARAGTATNER